MNLLQSPRLIFGAVLAACAALLAYAYYAEFVLDLEPCPLCILQRFAFVVMGLGALLGTLHGSTGRARWVYVALIWAGGIWGLITAGRHIWLQNLPADQVPDCGPGLEFMMEYFGLFEALQSAFTGAGECAEVDWSFVGLSMPVWTAIWYVVLMAVPLIAALKVRR